MPNLPSFLSSQSVFSLAFFFALFTIFPKRCARCVAARSFSFLISFCDIFIISAPTVWVNVCVYVWNGRFNLVDVSRFSVCCRWFSCFLFLRLIGQAQRKRSSTFCVTLSVRCYLLCPCACPYWYNLKQLNGRLAKLVIIFQVPVWFASGNTERSVIVTRLKRPGGNGVL